MLHDVLLYTDDATAIAAVLAAMPFFSAPATVSI